jgi:hypothetical protein
MPLPAFTLRRQNRITMRALLILSIVPSLLSAQVHYGHGIYAFTPEGENYLEIKSEGAPAKRIGFTIAYGDWYILPNDASATIYLVFQQNGTEYALDLAWTGTEKTQPIVHYNETNEERFFIYHESTKDSHGYSCSPQEEGDEVRIHVAQMSESDLAATIEGDLRSNLRAAGAKGFVPVHVTGRISLHKNPKDRVVTSRFGDCDPVVHNRIPGALNRTPSDCERKFVRYMDSLVEDFFQPLRDYFAARGWRENFSGKHELTSLPWRTEESFMSLEFGAPHSRRMFEDPEGKKIFDADRYQFLTDSMEQDARDKGKEPDMSAIVSRATAIMDNEARFGWAKISFEINEDYDYVYGGELVQRTLPGAAFFIQAARRKGATHGLGPITGLSYGETCIGFGRWEAPVIKDYDQTTKELVLHTRYKAEDPHLTVQSICIRIEARPELSDQIAQLLDWKKLPRIF